MIKNKVIDHDTFKAGKVPGEITGTPTPGNGVRIPTAKQINKYLEDPKIRAGISRAERIMGGVSTVRVMKQKELVHDMLIDSKVRFNKKAIDIGLKKASAS